MTALLSQQYKSLLRAKHEHELWGETGARRAPDVISFARELGAKSIIDYGCGRGMLGRELRNHGYHVFDYDPGIVGEDILPPMSDLVVCTDVLEHIEPEFLTNVLADIRSRARLGIYLVISLHPAIHLLPDGRNAHLIVKPSTWWIDTLTQAGMKPNSELGQVNELKCWIKCIPL